MNTVSERSFEKALDKIRSLSRTNAKLRKSLEHAVNWGHGFEGTGTRPEWLTEAEEAIRKAQP